jgi:hypothetical protein
LVQGVIGDAFEQDPPRPSQDGKVFTGLDPEIVAGRRKYPQPVCAALQMDLNVNQRRNEVRFNDGSSGTDHIEVIIEKGASVKDLSSGRADVTRGPDDPLG